MRKALQEKNTTFRTMTIQSGATTKTRREAALLNQQLCRP
jgi:hypothetical protein